jgi:tetratricopeptide (TPR) repeat protein
MLSSCLPANEAEAIVEAFAAAWRRVEGVDGRAPPAGVEAAVLRVIRGEIEVNPSAEVSARDSDEALCAAAEALSALGHHAQAFALLRRLHPRRSPGVARAAMRALPHLLPADLFDHRRWISELIAATAQKNAGALRAFIRLLAANAHLDLVDAVRGSPAGAFLASADHAIIDAIRTLWEARPSDAIRGLESHGFDGADRDEADLLRAAALGMSSPGRASLAALEAIAKDPSRSSADRDTANRFCGEISLRLRATGVRRVPDHPVKPILAFIESRRNWPSRSADVEALGVRFVLQQLCDAGFEHLQDLLRAPFDQWTEAQLWSVIGLFGGNRTAAVTVLEGPHLRRLDLLSMRQRAAACQLRIPYDGPDGALRALAHLEQQWPGGSMFSIYKGEIFLWLGRYEDAARAFDEPHHRLQTRWGFIGHGAALAHLGRDDEALRVWDGARAHHPEPLPGEATLTYRAEVHLRRGEMIEARGLLDRALSHSPTRLRAWLLGADIALREGAIEDARAALFQAAALCPALFSDTVKSASELLPRLRSIGAADLLDLCIEARTRMRGNASRRLFTWVDSRGGFRAFASVPHKELAAALGLLAHRPTPA